MFRSPANLKVGRQPLDAEVMEALEHTHPDLSFDWGAISRESARKEPSNDRQARRPPRSSDRPAPRPAPERPAARLPVAIANDGSILSRVLGATEAARLRGRYSELLQRIGRRARSPEERDRLFERLRRLNPDEWTDEAAIRAEARGIDASWNAVSAELPSRRRGRRGGRRRPEGDRGASGIMGEGNETLENGHEVPEDSQMVRAAGTVDPGGDSGRVGAEPSAEAEADAPDPDLPVGD
jgi:hypothetical protein